MTTSTKLFHALVLWGVALGAGSVTACNEDAGARVPGAASGDARTPADSGTDSKSDRGPGDGGSDVQMDVAVEEVSGWHPTK